MRIDSIFSIANNSNVPEHSQAIGELQRLSVSGDWSRYAADSSTEAQPKSTCSIEG